MVDKIELAQQVEEKLKSTIREGRELLSDFIKAKKEIDYLYRTLNKLVQKHIEDTVRKNLDEMGEETQKAMRESVEKVISEFDNLSNSILGNGTEDRPHIKQMIDEKIRREVARRNRG